MTPSKRRTSLARNRNESRVQWVAALPSLIDPLLRGPALVVEADDGTVRPGQSGDDEADPREQLAEVMLDLDDHPPRPVPGGGLILEAAVAHQRGVARPAAPPGQEILDGPLQDIVGREADRVPHTPPLQRFVQGWQGKGRISSDDEGVSSGLAAIDDGEEHLIPSVSTVDVARPERGGQAVAALVEDEERGDSRRTRSGRCRLIALAPRAPDSRNCRYRGSRARPGIA